MTNVEESSFKDHLHKLNIYRYLPQFQGEEMIAVRVISCGSQESDELFLMKVFKGQFYREGRTSSKALLSMEI